MNVDLIRWHNFVKPALHLTISLEADAVFEAYYLKTLFSKGSGQPVKQFWIMRRYIDSGIRTGIPGSIVKINSAISVKNAAYYRDCIVKVGGQQFSIELGLRTDRKIKILSEKVKDWA
ncbi:MAG: hypothetical protein WCY41_01845 [Candidatus Micrarchaeia archaeon]